MFTSISKFHIYALVLSVIVIFGWNTFATGGIITGGNTNTGGGVIVTGGGGVNPNINNVELLHVGSPNQMSNQMKLGALGVKHNPSLISGAKFDVLGRSGIVGSFGSVSISDYPLVINGSTAIGSSATNSNTQMLQTTNISGAGNLVITDPGQMIGQNTLSPQNIKIESLNDALNTTMQPMLICAL